MLCLARHTGEGRAGSGMGSGSVEAGYSGKPRNWWGGPNDGGRGRLCLEGHQSIISCCRHILPGGGC